MIYVKFVCNTPYCGTESIYYQEFEEEDEKLFDEICEEYARENGESYEHLINGWGEPVDEDDLDWYFVDCYANSYWEILSEEEYHDESGW